MKKETIEQPQLNNEELAELLIELADSKYWSAIMTYYNGLAVLAEQTLKSVDPFKNPTEMARNQGFRSALDYLSRYIEEEKKNRLNKAKADEEKEKT